MNQPQPIHYQLTSINHTVVISNPKQLIVEQGHPSIDGGKIRHNGKMTSLVVRYDNKPELAAQIKHWQTAWENYEAEKESLTSRVKAGITTPTDYDDKAENDVFSWSYWDGTSGKQLFHKASGQYIYQMSFLDGPKGTMGTKVEGELKDQAVAFWEALRQLQTEPTPLYTGAESADFEVAEPQHGKNGYCRKCHSYCYGDCEAN